MATIPHIGLLVGFDSMRGPIRARIVSIDCRSEEMTLKACGNDDSSAYPDGCIFTTKAHRVAPWRNFKRKPFRWTPVEWQMDYHALVHAFLTTP